MTAVDITLAFLGAMFAVHAFIAARYRRYPTITAIIVRGT